MTLYLVSCVSKKGGSPMRAEDLYQSDWFRKAHLYIQQRIQEGDSWYILSAKYHLIAPHRVLPPYNQTLLKMGLRERQEWASKVLPQIQTLLTTGDQIVFLAGEHYREFLEPVLKGQGYKVSVPMRGLGIGRQLEWLSIQIRSVQKKTLWEE